MTITIDQRIAQLTKELTALDITRRQAQQEADASVSRMRELGQRISDIQTATTTLAGWAPIAPEKEWLDLLTGWRKTLSEELLALPPRTDPHTLGVQQNLVISIRTIDFGLGVVTNTGYDLTTLRLGALMREAGYEPVGADPARNYCGQMPWFGSIPQVEDRIANRQRERDEAQARLDEALLNDEERERQAAERAAECDILNGLRLTGSDISDGQPYHLVPHAADGSVLAELTPIQAAALERANRTLAAR